LQVQQEHRIIGGVWPEVAVYWDACDLVIDWLTLGWSQFKLMDTSQRIRFTTVHFTRIQQEGVFYQRLGIRLTLWCSWVSRHRRIQSIGSEEVWPCCASLMIDWLFIKYFQLHLMKLFFGWIDKI
jgi:hypothetical protein